MVKTEVLKNLPNRDSVEPPSFADWPVVSGLSTPLSTPLFPFGEFQGKAGTGGQGAVGVPSADQQIDWFRSILQPQPTSAKREIQGMAYY